MYADGELMIVTVKVVVEVSESRVRKASSNTLLSGGLSDLRQAGNKDLTGVNPPFSAPCSSQSWQHIREPRAGASESVSQTSCKLSANASAVKRVSRFWQHLEQQRDFKAQGKSMPTCEVTYMMM